ncbi:MAG: hypothetical protein ABJI36_09620, partial [Kangiellaceae bacterium]
ALKPKTGIINIKRAEGENFAILLIILELSISFGINMKKTIEAISKAQDKSQNLNLALASIFFIVYSKNSVSLICVLNSRIDFRRESSLLSIYTLVIYLVSAILS